MTAFLQHPRVKRMIMLLAFLLARGLPLSKPDLSGANNGERTQEEQCPPCELLFRGLEKNEGSGKLTKAVRVQERGEPKSGTGMMMDWATGALVQTCNYLQQLFGTKSCRVDFAPELENDGHLPARPVLRRMVFEPALGVSDARCPCESIERVSIVTTNHDKHGLPVNRTTCAFSHNGGIELAPATKTSKNQNSACRFADETPARNNDDIWRCMHEANCDITDDWLQMVVFRDPRPAVVSSYYHLMLHNPGVKDIGELEEFVARELPMLCEWMSVRYILFSGFLAEQSMEFWYTDSIADPLEWYYRWFYFVGLQLPAPVVQIAAEAAAANDLGFHQKLVDKHPGEQIRINTAGVRRFEDEVSAEVLKAADDVLRVWLPALLLEKLGVEPAMV